MKKEELIENIINGNISTANPVTIFNGEIFYVNQNKFNAIFNKVNENNWANKKIENCNIIICGNFIIVKVDKETVTIKEIMESIDMSEFEKRLENPAEYDKIVEQYNKENGF